MHDVLAPEALVGCGAGGVLADGHEVERGTAVAVWAARLDGGEATPFHAELAELEGGELLVTGIPDLEGASAMLLFPEAEGFPTDDMLGALADSCPALPVLGGLSSALGAQGTSALFVNDRVVDRGAVGVRLDGVELIACVSQGAAPVGPELTVTAAEGQMILELAGAPALTKLRDVFLDLPEAERRMLASGPLVGLVIDGDKPDYVHGDFLVRGLVGADPDTGAVAVGAGVRTGQVLRLHGRDAASADRDLRDSLALRRLALGDETPAGALMLTCNGRGRALFGEVDHDVGLLARELRGAPSAGFFAAGEIGPVGGESFVHGYTATVAVFP